MPRAVKVLCAILILVPLIEGAARHSQAHSYVPQYYRVPSDWMSMGCLAMYACLAAGLAKGINWIRWCFVIVATIGLVVQFIWSMSIAPIVVGSLPPLPGIIGLAIWIAHFTAVILCLGSSANAYFRQKNEPNQAPTPTAVTPPAGQEARQP